MALRRVVVTGMGAVSPLGIGTARLMEGMSAGRSGVVSQRTEWQEHLRDLTCWVAAPLKETIDVSLIPRRARRSMGRVAILAYTAAIEALEQARLTQDELHSPRTGVSLASTMGSTAALEQFFRAFHSGEIGRLPSGIFFQLMSHTCAANVACALGITGRLVAPSAACASSLQSLGCGFDAIQRGDQDIMLCGGAEEMHALASASFDLIRAASSHFNDRPSQTPRPFDRDRDGTVCGEGAGVLVLESEEGATARGAPILAEMIGYATNTDGTHMTQPHSESIAACLQQALDQSGWKPEDVAYINAHATGTPLGDQEEAKALRTVFGENRVPVSGFKGYLGHTLGASGALELIACITMQRMGCVLPTLNLSIPGEGCEGLDHVTTRREGHFGRFLKSSFALGGVNTVVAFREVT